jgi:hypothetical protein
VDLQRDRQHCGSCGTRCEQNEECCQGRCLPLDSLDNCGGCFRACAQSQACCESGTTYTCTSVETTTDCGLCGNSCDPSQSCEDGVCK